MKCNWYEMNEEERIKEVYSKYKIADFWDWWSDGEKVTMEVRTQDNYDMVKKIAYNLKVPSYKTSLFISNAKQLKHLLKNTKNVWFGINPRKWNWVAGKNFKHFAGTQYHVDAVKFIFVDIDRQVKDGIASSNDLMHADRMADHILEALGKEDWAKSYCKICSGHGVQLLIKLDVPINLPQMKFNEEEMCYEYNEEFELIKKIMKSGVGNKLMKFGKKFPELNIDIDKAAFDLARVGALPYSINYKYNTKRWRAIVDMKDGVNDGLTDNIRSYETDIKEFRKIHKRMYKVTLTEDEILKEKELFTHPLVEWFLSRQFPAGGINNTIWYEIKKLARESGIDFNGKAFRRLHDKVKKYHKRTTLSANIPPANQEFNKRTINNYCLNNWIEPFFTDDLIGNLCYGVNFSKVEWWSMERRKPIETLDYDTRVCEDINEFRRKIIPGDIGHNNIKKFQDFILGCRYKYGDEKAEFIFNILKKVVI